MTKEPVLLFKLSAPTAFQCSACDAHNGVFDSEGWAIDIIDAFRDHLRRYHPEAYASLNHDSLNHEVISR